MLARLGLGRPELRAWAMYDFANSAFQSTIITAIFPVFFATYAGDGLPPGEATARFAWATTIAVTITALIGPILGAVADYRALKKRMLASFMIAGVIATLMMATITRGGWAYAAALFVVANFPTSPRRTRSIGCRRPPMPSAFSAAESCWRSIWRGFFDPRRSASPAPWPRRSWPS
jgi:UMF1 family MFS transporter